MALYSTYQQVGIKEDVSNIITNLDPTKTPFQSMIKKGKVDNTLYQWQEDELARVRDNANVEGADASDATLTPTVMRSNRTQILEKTIKVSGTSDAVATYGRAKELAYQSQKAAKEVKRDLEHALIGKSQNAVTGDSSSTPRRFGNVFGNDAGGNALVHADVRIAKTAVTGGALDEAAILDLHETMFEYGADPSILMVTPSDSRLIATFANASGRTRDISQQTKIVNAVDLYVSPFGELKVVVNRFLKRFIADEAVPPRTAVDPATDGDSNPDSLGAALIFDPMNWELCTLRGWSREKLAKVGDSERYQILGEFGLKHSNYHASGVIENLT